MNFLVRGSALRWCTVLSCSFCMLLFGYDQGLMSGLITADNFKMEIFGTLTPSSSLSSLVVAIYEIGAFIGSLSTMIFGQRLGRKKSTIIAQTITIIGAVLQSSSFGLGQMIAARIVSGFGVGILTATIPVWTAEMAPASMRGRANGTMAVSAVIGVVIAYWVDYGCALHKSAFSFRFPLAFQIVFCLIQLSTISFVPESPRWLIARGHEKEAQDVIMAIHDASSLNDGNDAATMHADIHRAVELEKDGNSDWRSLFTMGDLQYFRRIMLAFGTQAMQQLTGINVIAYYSTVVFEQSLHLSRHLSLLLAGFSVLAWLFGGCIGILFIDRVGRRRLMMYGFSMTCVSMMLMAIGTSKDSRAYGILATFGIFFFTLNFGIGCQVPPWLYGVEVTPLKLRYMAGATAAASGWIWNYSVVQATQPGLTSLGYRYFIIWAAFNFCFVFIVYFFYPETAKKSLEEIDFLFHKNGDPTEASLSFGRSVAMEKHAGNIAVHEETV